VLSQLLSNKSCANLLLNLIGEIPKRAESVDIIRAALETLRLLQPSEDECVR
jgi:hypothetical protein